jgi:hypothetical protein
MFRACSFTVVLINTERDRGIIVPKYENIAAYPAEVGRPKLSNARMRAAWLTSRTTIILAPAFEDAAGTFPRARSYVQRSNCGERQCAQSW